MVTNRHLGNALIIFIKYMTLRVDMASVQNNRFLNMEIKCG